MNGIKTVLLLGSLSGLLILGGQMLGCRGGLMMGLLIAVPSASALAVLIRFVLGKYLDSPIYWGQQRIRTVETEASGEHDEVA